MPRTVAWKGLRRKTCLRSSSRIVFSWAAGAVAGVEDCAAASAGKARNAATRYFSKVSLLRFFHIVAEIDAAKKRLQLFAARWIHRFHVAHPSFQGSPEVLVACRI